MTDTVKVKSYDGKRTHFEGLYDDAKRFVENHFPRMHVEPGSNNDVVPDVVIQHGTGENDKAHFDGTTWHNEPGSNDTANDVPAETGVITDAPVQHADADADTEGSK